MLTSCIKGLKISGISTVVPKQSRNLLDDPELYGGNEKKIHRIISSSGFYKRRIVDPETTALDLCEQATHILLDGMQIKKETLDAVVFVTYTPDYVMPSNASIIHKRLGLSESCAIFDVSQGCAGYVYGLWISGMMLQSGLKKVLLLVGDTFTKFEDMFVDHSAPIFGDAGTATLLEYDDKKDDIQFSIGSDGNGYDAIICENIGFRNPPTPSMFNEDGSYQYNSKMDGLRVFNFAMEKVPPCVKEVLNNNKVNKDDIDYFVFHQANKFMIQTIMATLGIDLKKVPLDTLTEYGNQSCASIPAAICNQLKNEVSQNSLKLLLCGFGVGLSWAGTVVNLDHIYCSGIHEFIKK